MIEAMWKSVCNHIQDIHEEHSDLYPACAHGPLDEEERDKEWLQPCRKFWIFCSTNKSLLLISYFFVSYLICSIKGLWKADRYPYKQVSSERHQDVIASLSNLLSRSPAKFGYHICSQAHGIRILGYACQVKWPLFLCSQLILTLIDVSVREYRVFIQYMVFYYLDYFWLRFIIMKTVTDCKL